MFAAYCGKELPTWDYLRLEYTTRLLLQFFALICSFDESTLVAKNQIRSADIVQLVLTFLQKIVFCIMGKDSNFFASEYDSNQSEDIKHIWGQNY